MTYVIFIIALIIFSSIKAIGTGTRDAYNEVFKK